MTSKPVLAFISTRFLFPADSGGKIRTTQVLRGLKGGAFHIRLLMPCDADLRERFAADIESVCDELISWESTKENKLLVFVKKVSWLFSEIPIPVMSDWNSEAGKIIRREISRFPAIAVFDFPHSAILAPDEIDCPSLVFTHNIETEIFERHVGVAKSILVRAVWRNQCRKMAKFERTTLSRFDAVIAVSVRDCEHFTKVWGVPNCSAIPTGVDTDYFRYAPPREDAQVVFCGSMDWLANIDAMTYFYNEIWPQVICAVPNVRMKVVGRAPPPAFVKKVGRNSPEWHFTGYVDDVRPHISGATVFVIPLRVGGGTRIKAFEAMAMGCPVVSTAVGIEGLTVVQDEHFWLANDANTFATKVIHAIENPNAAIRLSKSARSYVRSNYDFRVASSAFEIICNQTIKRSARQ